MTKLSNLPEHEKSKRFENIIIKLKKYGRDYLKKEPLQLENVSLLLIDLMEHAEKFNELSGLQKKEAVKSTLSVLVDESNIAGDLEPLVLRLIPRLIDNFVEIKDGKRLRINSSISRKIHHLFARLCCISLDHDPDVEVPPPPLPRRHPDSQRQLR